MVNPAGPDDLKILISALATPMAPNEQINWDRLSQLVQAYLTKGVEGIYCCGSSGEGLLLTAVERTQLVEAVCREVAGRVPVIAHVGALSTRECIQLAEAAARSGAVAVSMIPPIYYSYSASAVVAHYRAVMDAVDLPMILYNIPQFTSVEFNARTGGELLADPRVIGVKQTAHNMFALEQMKATFPDKAYINGFDEIFVPAMAAGAEGSIGTTVGVQLELFVAARARFEKGDLHGAMRVQSRINQVIAELVAIDVFPAAKHLSGRDAGGLGSLGNCRAPFEPLSGSNQHRIAALETKLADHVRETLEEGWR